MVAALELYLDVHATRRIRPLWQALEAEGIPSLGSLNAKHRPPVSLAAAHRMDPEAVVAAVEGVPGLTLSMDFVGQFVGRVLWLGVTVTDELLAHHRTVHERLSGSLSVSAVS
ncbi:hypothetical protein ACQP2E_36845 [Actinoplanes sp. CA-015351]|uniref:hypothetical protein n=1 Tax=Actinoplanes sp. CA-015351 TaxID=3239897 RepID=UPI003D99CA44